MSKILGIIFLTFITNSAFAESYSEYYKLINSAEKAFVDNNHEKSFLMYDKAFSMYKRPFAKDAYIAAQIAYYIGDTTRFIEYLSIGFDNDMPLTAITAAPILSDIQNKNIYAEITKAYRTRRAYEIDEEARDLLYVKFYEVQRLKDKMGRDKILIQEFAKEDEKLRLWVYENFLKNGTFPSDNTIGIFTDSSYLEVLAKNDLVDERLEKLRNNSGSVSSHNSKAANVNVKFYSHYVPDDMQISNYKALVPFLHSTCSYKKYHSEMWQAVLNGYLHPKDYAMLYTWSIKNSRKGKQMTSINYCEYDQNEQNKSFGLLSANINDEQIPLANENRKDLLIQEYHVDMKKRELEKTAGFKFFFGFLNQR